ncbi:MAG: hypothetical protein AAFV95_06055 [Bacteroidota bacterium]
MADGIHNAGRKGYCLMGFFIGFFLFVGLIVYIYRYNFNLEF